MTCPYCKATVDGDSLYCRSCGRELPKKIRSAAPSEQGDRHLRHREHHSRKGQKRISAALIAVVLLLSCGLGVFTGNLVVRGIDRQEGGRSAETAEMQQSPAAPETPAENTGEVSSSGGEAAEGETGSNPEGAVSGAEASADSGEEAVASGEETSGFFDRLKNMFSGSANTGYRVLCIGNSVTQHPYVPQGQDVNGYWLADWGMAASSRETDYAHVLARKIQETKGTVDLAVTNYSMWELAEAAGQHRVDYLQYLDPYFEGDLGKNTALVVLQLGESCTVYNELYVDLVYLVDYLREKAPNAVIAMTGTIIKMDPAGAAATDDIKRVVCGEKGIPFVDMSAYNESLWVGEGAQIVNPETGEVTVISLNQRTHPGDAGMQWIADQIYQAVADTLP